MAQPDLTSLSKESLDQLNHFSILLHLFYHRNKNQHRRSTWWRHFSIFRRHLSHLLSDYASLLSVPSTNLERTRKKARDQTIRARIEQRLGFWQNVLVPRWSRAFGQVVVDGRFAVLGLVLMSILAAVCAGVGLVARFEELGQVEVERVLEEFGREVWGGEAVGVSVEGEVEGLLGIGYEDAGRRVEREDNGEAVERQGDDGVTHSTIAASTVGMNGNELYTSTDELLDDSIEAVSKPKDSMKDQVEPITAKKTKKRPSALDPKAAKKVKKRKTTGDAIDDLFSGL